FTSCLPLLVAKGNPMCKKSLRTTAFLIQLIAFPMAAVGLVSAQQVPLDQSLLSSVRTVNFKGNYSVRFPNARVGQTTINSREEMSVDADVDGAGLYVVCVDMNNPGPAEKFFDDMVAESQRETKSRTVWSRPFVLSGGSGREVELENDRGWKRLARHYL